MSRSGRGILRVRVSVRESELFLVRESVFLREMAREREQCLPSLHQALMTSPANSRRTLTCPSTMAPSCLRPPDSNVQTLPTPSLHLNRFKWRTRTRTRMTTRTVTFRSTMPPPCQRPTDPKA